jgi:prepilin-type N-terminal cleavage/methylation domain-containing protein
MVNENKKQKGYSLIEVILGIALAGILTSGITTFTVQTITENARSNNRMQATMQVENAGYWVSRDVQMSSNLTLGGAAGFPLQLEWKDTDGSNYQVTLTLAGNQIKRSLVKNSQAPLQTVIAESVNSAPGLTNCVYSGGLLTFNVTATLGKVNVSRSYEVKKRLDLK